MELEKAKEIIKSIDTLDDYELQEAIETVIGELFAMQNLLDEKNEEIEHLQKENEQYISGELMTRNQAKHFEEINKKYYIHKDDIREKIDNRISTVENLLDEMVDKNTGCINTSYLSKKEKEEVIAKRNCLIVQKATLIDMKNDLLKEE